MNSLIAIGAGIAALTGIGAGIGIGLATSKATEKSQKHYYLDVHWPKVLQFSVW